MSEVVAEDKNSSGNHLKDEISATRRFSEPTRSPPPSKHVPISPPLLLEHPDVRGWFHLLFIMVAFHVVSQNAHSFLVSNTVAGWIEFLYLFHDAPNLLTYWITVVSISTVIPYAMTAANRRGWLGKNATVFVLAVFSFFFLTGVGRLVWTSQTLPASQMMFMLAQSAVLWMKFHSYVIVNAENTDVKIRGGGVLDYAYFLCAPTLVYQMSFRRTERIRWSFFLERLALAIVLFAGLHSLSVSHITPVLGRAAQLSVVDFVSRLLVPMTAFYIMLFFFTFECVLNCLAEILRFADRDFYQDWWNSTTFDEFARKWNVPVHNWLGKHIYADARQNRSLSKPLALFLTFLFSAIFHELILMMLVKSWKPFLFPMQMSQVWLIYYLGPKLKGTKLGNIVFHLGISIGIPLLTCFYAREYAIYRQQ